MDDTDSNSDGLPSPRFEPPDTARTTFSAECKILETSIPRVPDTVTVQTKPPWYYVEFGQDDKAPKPPLPTLFASKSTPNKGVHLFPELAKNDQRVHKKKLVHHSVVPNNRYRDNNYFGFVASVFGIDRMKKNITYYFNKLIFKLGLK